MLGGVSSAYDRAGGLGSRTGWRTEKSGTGRFSEPRRTVLPRHLRLHARPERQPCGFVRIPDITGSPRSHENDASHTPVPPTSSRFSSTDAMIGVISRTGHSLPVSMTALGRQHHCMQRSCGNVAVSKPIQLLTCPASYVVHSRGLPS